MYVAILPIFNTTRMDIVRDITVDFSLNKSVSSLEFSSGGENVMKVRVLTESVLVRV